MSVVEFIGRLHPVLVHLPIGILLTGLLLQSLSRYPKFGISPAVVTLVLLCGMFSALLSCITGYLLSFSGEYDPTLVTLHMWMGLGVWMISMGVLAFHTSNIQPPRRSAARNPVPQGSTSQDLPSTDPAAQASASRRRTAQSPNSRAWTSPALSLILLVAIIVTGHLGGSLTHGSDYLTSALNGTSGPAAAIHKPIPDIQEAKVYGDIVQPVLQANCYSCHGPDKQKGRLRLDDSAWIVKGGKSGAANELVKRILLTIDDEHHMPPKEKPPLKESEIAILQWWVGQGMDFSHKVKDLPHPGRIATYLLLLQDGNGGGAKAASLVPAAPVEAAAEKDMEKLRAKKVQLIPVAQGNNYLSANFINASHITDKDLSDLLRLQKQLIWIKLGGQPVGDSGMVAIGQCKALTILDLSHTQISDKGLASLQALTNLRLLNLVGTNVTAHGVLSLAPLRQLQSIFLYHTKVESKDWPSLKQHFPKTALDSGGYAVPFAPLDTTNEMRPKK